MIDADDDGVWCKCGAQMHAVEGRRYPGARAWLWWSCKACGHVDGTSPLPRRPTDVLHSQGDPSCTTRSTPHPSGSSSAHAS